jgi:hypothetical protein
MLAVVTAVGLAPVGTASAGERRVRRPLEEPTAHLQVAEAHARRRWKSLSPERRRRVRERLHRALHRRSVGEGEAWRRRAAHLDAEERRRLRQRLRELPAAERRGLHRELFRFRTLPAERQQALRERLSRFQSLDSHERERIRANAARWRALSREDRERLRAAWRHLKRLPPDEQQRLLDRVFTE